MLCIEVPSTEMWDERTEQFIYGEATTLQLEHSLISLSKWESRWNKPFLTKEDKTPEELLDYIRCMTINRVDPEVYLRLTPENISTIDKYIGAPMTATTINDHGPKSSSRGEIVTSELIYYWMVTFNIPFECQKWHLNRLMTLIRVCEIKNRPPKKMNKRDIMTRNAALNAARRKKMNSKG